MIQPYRAACNGVNFGNVLGTARRDIFRRVAGRPLTAHPNSAWGAKHRRQLAVRLGAAAPSLSGEPRNPYWDPTSLMHPVGVPRPRQSLRALSCHGSTIGWAFFLCARGEQCASPRRKHTLARKQRRRPPTANASFCIFTNTCRWSEGRAGAQLQGAGSVAGLCTLRQAKVHNTQLQRTKCGAVRRASCDSMRRGMDDSNSAVLVPQRTA